LSFTAREEATSVHGVTDGPYAMMNPSGGSGPNAASGPGPVTAGAADDARHARAAHPRLRPQRDHQPVRRIQHRRRHRFHVHFTRTGSSWIDTWNENQRPFTWTKTAEEILDSFAKYKARISGA
jgi:hypothetical protein